MTRDIQDKGCITMKYKWDELKLSRKQHICTDNGLSLCKVENGTKRRLIISQHKHPKKDICGICIHLLNKGKKKKRLRRKKKTIKADNFYNSYEWRTLRYRALKLNDGCCELCGRSKKDGVVLNVDHIESVKERPDLRLKLSNLQVLCGACNHGKGNWDETDWREPSLKVLMSEGI